MHTCPFCALIAKQLPADSIYEDENTLVILPKEIESYGHTLIIPKQHYLSFFDIPKTELHHLMDTTQVITLLYQEKLGTSGINLLHASGEDAGQSVQHFHFHLFPRFSDDNIDLWPKFPNYKADREHFLNTIK
ncbi:MAG: HIT domain-containing protein [Candidatus Absconditabacteria bacterium]|nr:HIT domain-containing protein [Candidatus Absconditabacteria bacterium]MDD3868144.1 HIT domain-containing protein [Candidatus Absconditabacteria bacterium]MDD4714530.1 HIT domain-containing protein [Candidatus Absconditabacteria bacterium]